MDDLQATLRQQPNRRVLGVFPFYLWAWNVPDPDKFDERNLERGKKLEKLNAKRADKEKPPKKFKPAGTWWRETVGEPPVIYDSAAAKVSVQQIELYLLKHGWFDAEASFEMFPIKKRQGKVVYTISAKEPYTIRSLILNIPDEALTIYTEKSRSDRNTLQAGDQFNIEKLDAERELLNQYFRNRGYYDFNKELLYFNVDSSLSAHQVDLTLGIVPRKVPYPGDPDSLVTVPYKRYTIENITIIDKPYERNKPIFTSDTLIIENYRLIDQNQLLVKPKILAQNILFKPGEYYEIANITRTYRRLSTLPIVGATSIQFFPLTEEEDNTYLRSVISITPTSKQAIAFEANGTNRGGFLGISGSANYRNKNAFGSAELFAFNISGGVEAQQLLTQSESNNPGVAGIRNNTYFNTLEFGPEISLTFPTFLLPVKAERFAKSADPKTTIRANLSYQLRPDYERTRSFGAITYLWSESDRKKWQVSPLEVSLIKIFRSPEFDAQLIEIGDPFLINSFQDHFIVDARVVYTYNTQPTGPAKKNLYFYSASIETAGNALRGLYSLSNAQKNDQGSYEVSGIAFAQYIKTQHDFRYYRNHNEKMETAYRLIGGVGVPLANLNVLPFEKSFFGGGANDIRAWQARTLGPGSYRDPQRNFDKIGDILLEANVEYRFALIDVVEAAFFLDAGNIWTINSDPARPGADFEFDRFVSEIAFGTGTGVRLNFDFFIIRLDLGLQIKDPSLDRGERWLFQSKEAYNDYIDNLNADRPSDSQLNYYRWRWNLNLGIGYPF